MGSALHLAPEGRQVYRTGDKPNTQAPKGRYEKFII